MKHAQLIVAKIRPEIYRLIESGEKTWEVRDEAFYMPFNDYGAAANKPAIIQYVDLSGSPLGLWEVDIMSERNYLCVLEPDGSLNDGGYIAQRRSCVDEKLFRRLFSPEKPKQLYAIRLTRKLSSLADLLLAEEES